MQKLIESINKFKVSTEAAELYTNRGIEICERVDGALANDPDVLKIIGNRTIQDINDNHRYQAEFMRNMLRLNNFEALPWMMVWAYRIYSMRGIPNDYFLKEFREWQNAIRSVAPEKPAQEICDVYQWIINHHDDFLHLAYSSDIELFSTGTNCKEVQNVFLRALLKGDYQFCKDIAGQFVNDPRKVAVFNGQVIQPSLYEIGNLWERGQITVAHEYRATAIVYKVMTIAYTSFIDPIPKKKHAVITAGVNEFHEVGARMIADQLGVEGWQVDYFGNNTSMDDLIKLLKGKRPFFLGISVVMHFNLDKTRSLIQEIRKDSILKDIPIMVGGSAFSHSDNLWRLVGADGYGTNSVNAVQLANAWWDESAKKA